MVNGRPLWQLLLAIFLVLWGILALTNITFTGSNVVMAVFAFATALCWFLKIGGQ